MSLRMSIPVVAVIIALGLGPALPGAVEATDKEKKEKKQQASQGQKDKQLRGKPGINSGGQEIPPGEGEQTGKPGTMFGAPATLPPDDRAPGHEGADKGKKEPTAGGSH